MAIFNWFSIPIYEKSLLPPEQVEEEMLFYMREYDSNVYSLEKNKQRKNITGDTDGNADIANLREFSWLVEEVSRGATEYLKEFRNPVSREVVSRPEVPQLKLQMWRGQVANQS